MRGEHDRRLVLGDELHQVLQEFASRQWIEARDRLVEARGARVASPSPASTPVAIAARPRAVPRVAPREAEPLDPTRRELDVPLRIEPRPSRRCSPPTASCTPEHPGPGTRRARVVRHSRPVVHHRCVIDPSVGAIRPTARCNRVVLPAPFAPTSPTTRPFGNRERAVAQRPPPPVALTEARRRDRGHATSSLVGVAKRALEQRRDALVVEAGAARGDRASARARAAVARAPRATRP